MIGLFERTHILLGDEGIQRLKGARVFLAGIGGVGSFVAESLARMGVGYLYLVDHDVVSSSNLNRQLVALETTVGQQKVAVMKERIHRINPACHVDVSTQFLRMDDMPDLFSTPYDVVIDAIDSLSCKVALVREAYERGYPVFSSMGAGGKLDPTCVQVADISKTHMCALARKMRSRLRRQGVYKGVQVVFSTEKPIPPLPPVASEDGTRARAVNGTVSYMPAIFGLTLAGVVVNHLLT